MHTSIRLGSILLLVSGIEAADLPPVDADLPQPLDAKVADEMLAHSPFTRIVSLEDTIQLTGVAFVEGKPVASFLNKATHERMIVSEEPNAQGWKITEAIRSGELQNTEVHVMIGDEMVVMHYGNTELKTRTSKGGSRGSSSRSSRSSSGDSSHVKTSSLLGENGLDLYNSLSRTGQGKLKAIVQSHVGKHPEQSMEENSAYAKSIYEKIKAGDEKSSGDGAPASSPRTSRSMKKKKS